MTKLSGVYTFAGETGRAVDEVALERYGSLRQFDAAREEKMEMDRRKTYGAGYAGKNEPTGELYRERMAKESAPLPAETRSAPDHRLLETPGKKSTIESTTAASPTDPTALNKLKAQLIRARLRKAPNMTELEAQDKAAVQSKLAAGPTDVVLDVMESRALAGTRAEAKAVNTKRGRERGLVEENNSMTIEGHGARGAANAQPNWRGRGPAG